jgi:hypothetical protein
MRYLITILLTIGFLLVLNLKAANFMTKDAIIKAKDGKSGFTVYQYQGPCEVKNKKPCYKIDGKNIKKDFFKKVFVDNPKKPLWSQKRNKFSCQGYKDCYAKLKELDCSKLPGGGYEKYINLDYTLVYCIKKIGYKKILIEEFIN